MQRRTLLRSLLSLPAMAVLPANSFAQETPKTATTGAEAAASPVIRTFSKPQFAALRKLGELMMPATPDAPGALEAGAAEFLDFLIGVSPATQLTLYRNGLDRLNAEAQRLYKKPFNEITAQQAEPILAPLRRPWTYQGPSDPFAKFLIAAKADLLRATANSREYITVVSQKRRSAGGVGQYWYAIE